MDFGSTGDDGSFVPSGDTLIALIANDSFSGNGQEFIQWKYCARRLVYHDTSVSKPSDKRSKNV